MLGVYSCTVEEPLRDAVDVLPNTNYCSAGIDGSNTCRTPSRRQQLGVYSCAVEEHFWVRNVIKPFTNHCSAVIDAL